MTDHAQPSTPTIPSTLCTAWTVSAAILLGLALFDMSALWPTVTETRDSLMALVRPRVFVAYIAIAMVGAVLAGLGWAALA